MLQPTSRFSSESRKKVVIAPSYVGINFSSNSFRKHEVVGVQALVIPPRLSPATSDTPKTKNDKTNKRVPINGRYLVIEVSY